MASKIFSLQGKGLKLDKAVDIEPYLEKVDPVIIEEIHFGGNTIGVEAAKALGKFLEKTEVLKVADFADIFTGRLVSEVPYALTFICDALKSKNSLVELDLSDNAFGRSSVEPIVPFLTQNHSLQILKLNNNGFGPEGGEIIANALYESAIISKSEGKKSNLRVVVCGRNRLENGSAPAWAKALAAHGTLEEVVMPQNGIRMEGIIALAKGLAQNPSLKHIDLQDNTFTVDGKPDGVKAWAEALGSWPGLETLNLSDCVLSVEGEVPKLLEALVEGPNPELHTLRLQNNNLEATSFSLLAQNVGENLPKLRVLELQWNEVEEGEEHLESLGIALKARGGNLYVADEDEEEEEEEEKEEVEEPEVDLNPKKVPAVVDTAAVDKATDDLADLLSRVKIA